MKGRVKRMQIRRTRRRADRNLDAHKAYPILNSVINGVVIVFKVLFWSVVILLAALGVLCENSDTQYKVHMY